MFSTIEIYGNYLRKKKLNLTFDELYVAFLIHHMYYNEQKFGKKKAKLKEPYLTYMELLNNFRKTISKLKPDLEEITFRRLQKNMIPLGEHSIQRLISSGLFIALEEKGRWKMNIPEFRKMFVNKYDAFEELIDKLRNVRIEITNGQSFPVVSLDDYDGLAEKYAKAIDYNTDMHLKILDSIDFAKDNNLINQGIVKIVNSKSWLEWIEKKEKKSVNKIKRNTF